MIGRKSPKLTTEKIGGPQGFDDFDLQLGDVMRGERATMGKSLLDVQRELRIKASYIAAIENCDPDAFDTPGFIAGYVRSYARYLGLDPDEAFDHFCAESGFSVAHGMSDKASTLRMQGDIKVSGGKMRDPIAEPGLPFVAVDDSLLSRIEPGAIGSSLVLLALMAGIGYGGWTVLQEVQRVQVSPVDQTPVVLSDLDPVDGANPQVQGTKSAATAGMAGVFTPPGVEAFDRLYRPQALDVPVLVARDAPISTLDPDSVGLFAGRSPLADRPVPAGLRVATSVTANPGAGAGDMRVVAVRPAWVRIDDGAGKVLFSGILDAGDSYAVPNGVTAPEIEIGESGSVYFALNGVVRGPAGARGKVSTVVLTKDGVTAAYQPANPKNDPDLAPVLAALAPDQADPLDPVAAAIAAASRASSGTTAPGAMPKVLADSVPGVTIVASREAWVRVKAPSGATLFETIMQRGDTYRVPQTEQPPTIRTGDAGAVYFAVNGQTYGPYGGNGAIADNLALSPETVMQRLAVADLARNATLASIVAELSLAPASR